MLTLCATQQHTEAHREGPSCDLLRVSDAGDETANGQQGAFWAQAAGSAVTGAATHGRSPRAHWAAHAADDGPKSASPGYVAK